jgi:hypothetical protein
MAHVLFALLCTACAAGLLDLHRVDCPCKDDWRNKLLVVGLLGIAAVGPPSLNGCLPHLLVAVTAVLYGRKLRSVDCQACQSVRKLPSEALLLGVCLAVCAWIPVKTLRGYSLRTARFS